MAGLRNFLEVPMQTSVTFLSQGREEMLSNISMINTRLFQMGITM